MIHHILKSISVIFHPLIMPLVGVIFYFVKSPRFIPEEIMKAKLVSLSILTIILPILLYFLLKTLGKVKSVYLATTRERIIPLLLNAIVTILIIQRVIRPGQNPELYFFFVGILISTLSCLILAFFKFKASIHMVAISGVFMFFLALSVHFSININNTLALICAIMGAIATSRLHLKAHTSIELIIGFFVGLIPQLTLITHWF